MVKIKFAGAAQEVTGSMHLLEKDGFKLLLDCGMKQGKRKESYEANRNFPFVPGSVNSMILSHAHIDHSGNIPTLVKKGFNGRVYTTYATKELCELMLPDSAHVQEKDIEFINKKRAKQGKALFEVLYNEEEAAQSLKHFDTVSLGESFKISEDISAYFLNAGHILGSVLTVISVKDNDKTVKIAYTGDLGRKNLPMIQDPDKITDVDYLIIESTYGGRLHKDITNVFDHVAYVVNEAYKRGGKVVIPVFAVERAQEVLYVLNRLYTEKKIPPLKVYVDSPLTVKVTQVFKKHAETFDKDMMEFVANNQNPFHSKLVTYTNSAEESKALNEIEEPCIILSATGMCEAGRILHHLKNNITKAKNTILIVGFQAANTLGRRLIDGDKTVKIFGDEFPVNAVIERVNEFSGHADMNGLTDCIKSASAGGRLKKVFLVHGEPEQQEALKAHLAQNGVTNVFNPAPYSEEELEGK